MSASAEEFGAPELDATDYYERLGAPQSASADEIDDHTKKYVAQFKPELSDHENADERWERFNEARQTLNDESEKELYDVFRERFGPETGAEAYQTWEARDRPKDPARVDPVRDLGIAPESTGESDSRQRSDTDSARQESRTSTNRQSTRQKTTQQDDSQRRTQRRSTRQRSDLDTSGTHSTRSAEANRQTTASDSDESGTSVFDRITERVRASTRVAVAEITTLLSMFEWLLLATLAVGVVGTVAVPAVEAVSGVLPVSESLVQALVTAGLMAALSYPLAGMYFDRFVGERGGQLASPGRRAIESLGKPESALLIPTLVGLLAALGLVTGGGGFTMLIAGAALLSVHGRFRVIGRTRSLPEWTDNFDTAAGAAVVIALLGVFIQTGPDATFAQAMAAASPTALAVIVLSYLVAILGPVGAVVAARGE